VHKHNNNPTHTVGIAKATDILEKVKRARAKIKSSPLAALH
jgi:hypothetical protein